MTSHIPPQRGLLQTYGWLHLAWLGICKLGTLVFFRGCRLVRFPIALRGRSRIVFGRDFTCGYMARLDAFGPTGCLRFGDRVELNDFVHIGATESVTIGNDVLIASRVFISDHDHGRYSGSPPHSNPDERPKSRVEPARPVSIGDRVWIGEGVAILSGVNIGHGCIIGAGSVVTHDIPPECIAVGVPARVVRRYSRSDAAWLRVAP